jgi:hypothetical protein
MSFFRSMRASQQLRAKPPQLCDQSCIYRSTMDAHRPRVLTDPDGRQSLHAQTHRAVSSLRAATAPTRPPSPSCRFFSRTEATMPAARRPTTASATSSLATRTAHHGGEPAELSTPPQSLAFLHNPCFVLDRTAATSRTDRDGRSVFARAPSPALALLPRSCDP